MAEILLGKIMIGDCIFGITKSTLRLDCGLRLYIAGLDDPGYREIYKTYMPSGQISDSGKICQVLQQPVFGFNLCISQLLAGCGIF